MRIRLTPLTWFVVLTLIAVGLALGLPPDPAAVAKLNTTPAAYRLAVAVLLIPYIVIWYASFYAFAKLREYSRPIKSAKDGAAFHKITVGMGILAFSLIVPTIISIILGSLLAYYPQFKPATVILNNYLGLFPGMLAFLFLYNGSRELVRTVDGKTRNPDLRWHAPWFILISVTFALLAIQNQYRSNAYHLGTFLLVCSIIVPFIYGWMVGLLGAFNFHIYAKMVRGSLYKKGVKQIADGITVTIAGSIAIQFVNVSIMQRLNHSLGAVLIADYILLIIVVFGLGLMAAGTRKLKSIEEI